MRICMVGTGYVGLVTGACFAETGRTVVCVDRDTAKIASLAAGEVPIFEPGLGELLRRNVAQRRLSFSGELPRALADSNVVFIAVGTPSKPDGAADLRAVEAVAREVASHATRETLIVLKSTVPVGTNARIGALVADCRWPIHVVSNPEFLKEGEAIADFLRPDRVVIGCEPDDAFARTLMARLYQPVCLDKDRIAWMDPASAELTKYVSNTMLAMRISLMNEIALLCEKVGADIHAVRNGVGSDARIGSKFLYAGPGYGGSCLPKDVKALIHTARAHGVEIELAAGTDRVNERQKGLLHRKLRACLDRPLRGARIGVWGVSFKPRTDDVREAPALVLIDALLDEGAHVLVHDPEAIGNTRRIYGSRVTFVDDAYEAARDSDALCLLTEWRQYQNPDFERLRTLMRRPLIVDGRNIWSTYGLSAMGFEYEGIGVRSSRTTSAGRPGT
jgi:UDPglucose 6-dehydrogenase